MVFVTLKGDPLSSSVSAFNSSRGYNKHDQLSLIILRFFRHGNGRHVRTRKEPITTLAFQVTNIQFLRPITARSKSPLHIRNGDAAKYCQLTLMFV